MSSARHIFFRKKKLMRVLNVSPKKNDNYQSNFIIDDPLNRKHRSLTFVDNALHVLYTRVFIRKFPSIFEKPQNYVRPSAMHISNPALIKLMKVLKNNLAKNDIFVYSFSYARTNTGLLWHTAVRPYDNISHLFPLLLIGHIVTYIKGSK